MVVFKMVNAHADLKKSGKCRSNLVAIRIFKSSISIICSVSQDPYKRQSASLLCIEIITSN